MNSIKILMALLAVCVLAVPAFSMPDRGIGQETCKCKQICDCEKPMMENKCQDDNPNPCDSPMPMMAAEDGPVKVKVIKSMMRDRCQGDMSMMDQNGKLKVKIVKSMMDDRCQGEGQNPCDFPPMMGPENGLAKAKIVKSMMGDKCEDGRSMMGQDGNLRFKVVRSMMGDRCHDGDRDPCDCPGPMKEDRC